MESIHQRIERLRKAARMTQEALAKALGVTYQSVQQWEKEGGTAPSRKRLNQVAEVLGTTAAYLLHGTSPENKNGPLTATPQKLTIDSRHSQQWPFKRVPLSRIHALTQEDIDMIDVALDQIVSAYEARSHKDLASGSR